MTLRYLGMWALLLFMAVGWNSGCSKDATEHPTDTTSDTSTSTTEDDLPTCEGRTDDAECVDPSDKLADLDPHGDVESIEVQKDALIITLKDGASLPPFFAEGKILTGGRPNKKKRGGTPGDLPPKADEGDGPPGSGPKPGKANKPFLRKVVSISQEGNVVTVKTTKAPLNEAFNNLRLKRRMRISEIGEPLPFTPGSGPPGKADDGINWTKDCKTTLFSNESLSVSLPTCEFTVGLDLDVDIEIKWASIKKFHFSVKGDASVGLGLLVEASKSDTWENDKEIGPFEIGPFPIGPVTVSVEMSVILGYFVKYSVSGSVEYDYTWSTTLTLGKEYTKDEGWTDLKDQDSTSTVSGPRVSMEGTATAKVYAHAKVAFMLYGTLGVYAQVGPYVRAGIEASNTCSATLKGNDEYNATVGGSYSVTPGFEGFIGVQGDIFGLEFLDKKWKIFDREFDPLAEGDFVIKQGNCCKTEHCIDDNGCTVGAQCSDMRCTYESRTEDCMPCTKDINCDDGDKCTIDACNPLGFCSHTWDSVCNCSEDSDCANGDPCVEPSCVTCNSDVCPEATRCKWTSKDDCINCTGLNEAKVCNDDNPCTDDSCVGKGVDGVGKCLFEENGGEGCCSYAAQCDDGSDCTVDNCKSGLCTSSAKTKNDACCATSADCDDGDPNTTDFCSANECKAYAIPLN